MSPTSKAMLEDNKNATHRIQFRFSDDAYQRLERMKNRHEASTYAETVGDALRLYEWFGEQEADGYKIALIKDDKITEVKLIF